MNANKCTLYLTGWAIAASCLLVGCASTYVLESEPSGAQVSLKQKEGLVALGQTPLDFSASQLPEDQNFVLEFKKPGFETRSIEIMPIKQSRTELTVKLDTAADVKQANELAHSRKLITEIFNIQELVFRRKFVDALTEIKELEKKESKLPELFVLKGSIYFLMNDFEQAKESWKQALQLDPSLASIRMRIADLEKKGSDRK